MQLLEFEMRKQLVEYKQQQYALFRATTRNKTNMQLPELGLRKQVEYYQQQCAICRARKLFAKGK